MSSIKPSSVEDLRAQLGDLLRAVEQEVTGGERLAETLGGRLRAIIDRAAEGREGRVVVLVDEYDAPLLNVIDEEEVLDDVRNVMREFYIPLKACDAQLRFVFLTGITKFSQLSIFSELNNLVDISMNPDYAAVCGITEDELHAQLAPDVELLATKLGISSEEAFARLKEQYDGYRFCDESPEIYNPFSLLCAFFNGDLGSYWSGTDTLSSLLRLVRSYGWNVSDLVDREAYEEEFDAPTEQLDDPLPLLYQSGYLTIKAHERGSEVYLLGIPNREVSRGIAGGFVAHAGARALSDSRSFQRRFYRFLSDGDMEGALKLLRSYLAGIPYDLAATDEKAFQAALYLIFNLVDVRLESEVRIACGRIDAVVTVPRRFASADGDALETVYVMEFKYGRSASEALAQIDRKGYALPYIDDARSVVKVGVSFDPETRTIGDWLIAEAQSH